MCRGCDLWLRVYAVTAGSSATSRIARLRCRCGRSAPDDCAFRLGSFLKVLSRCLHAQIFGKTMVCKDIEVASQVMKQAHIDCITIAGDQVLKSGKLCGGFLDAGR